MTRLLGMLVIGLVVIAVGAELVVEGAVAIAQLLGLGVRHWGHGRRCGHDPPGQGHQLSSPGAAGGAK